ncbi:L,D-transpeptidase family protein [Spirosoma sp. 209]|uniref:L,D-transpeptidase family protein n=1 Tax=Spirosoma sp. 209 TaxID=1955701 RepID=UPI00098D40A5|nr:L,D-transpeptidase family protein [Spirosoma sp. 209]
MRYRWCIVWIILASGTARAQVAGDWLRLRQYGQTIGVDSLCAEPDEACLTRYFTQIVYGRRPRRLGYQGVAERIDTSRISRLTQQFRTGADWCPLLDSLESPDPAYRQLKEYCQRCLIDDYMTDSLTLEQVWETLNTYRWLNRFSASRRVVVNLPSATLRVIDPAGQTLLHSRVIVGKPATPTPSFTAEISSVVVYPYWNVPRSIMINEMLPAIRKNPVATLDALKLQVIDASGRVVDPAGVNWLAKPFPYRLRQSTGCDNALGLLKFNLDNPYDIYLHDTNARRLFTRSNRSLSHGCVRVEKPIHLANLLLGYTRFGPSFLTSCPTNASPKSIRFPEPVPVIVVYNVLDIDESNAIRVYRDVYGWWRLPL